MDPSYDLADSTDWLSTSLPAFEPLEAALRCEVCKEFYNNPVITACSHTFCSLCIRRCISNDGKCPACKNACQADKLVANIVVREVATRFQDARAKALELARAEDKAGAETAASGKKRKIEETDVDDEEGRRTWTRSRQTRSARREEANTTMEGDAVIIPDSDDENANDEEYVPEGMAKCPICNEIMKMEAVFNHVPVCPAAEHDNGGRNTRSRTNTVFHRIQGRQKEVALPTTRLPGLNYAMLTDKTLRRKLQELEIPSTGAKAVLMRRHLEWLNIYNSNCDASDVSRKSKRELLKDLEDWERTQGRSVSVKDSRIMRKDFDGQNHAASHKTQFNDLIANARKTKEAAKAKLEKPEEGERKDEDIGPDPSQEPVPANQESPQIAHSYEDNEAAPSKIGDKVEEVNQNDSVFPSLDCPIVSKSAHVAVETQTGDGALGLTHSFGAGTRRVPMFKMPQEPIVDVESSTIQ